MRDRLPGRAGAFYATIGYSDDRTGLVTMRRHAKNPVQYALARNGLAAVKPSEPRNKALPRDCGDGMMINHVTRRSALTGMGLTALFRYRPALAQQTALQDAYARISEYVRACIAAQQLAIDTEPYNVSLFIGADLSMRLKLVDAINHLSLFREFDDVRRYIRQIPQMPAYPPDYFTADMLAFQADALTLIQQAEFRYYYTITPVPDPSDIQPIGIPSIPQVNPSIPYYDAVVCIIILFETLNIFVDEGAILAFIEDNAEFRHDIEALLRHISNREYAEVIENTYKIVQTYVIGSNLVRVIIGEEAMGQLARLFLGRLAPVVGWCLLGGAFVMAIKRNYHKFSFA